MWDDLIKPFNLISFAISVTSLALAVVFFALSRKSKSITCIKYNRSAKIFDSKVSSPNIRVLDQNGELINEDVFLLETIVWNSGNLPIEPSDVRTPFSIMLKPCTKILDFKIARQTHFDIANIRLTEASPAANQTKIINVLWDHLDPRFGAIIQVLYSSEEEAKIDLGGYIVNVKNIMREKKDVKEEGFSFRSMRDILFLLTLSTLFIVFTLLGVFVAGIFGFLSNDNTAVISLGIALILGAFLGYRMVWLIYSNPRPPL
jgi:hypothetical protein